MAVKYEEVDILDEGIQYAEPTKGNFALNMLRRQGAWEVREGFGQLAEFDTLMPFSLNEGVGGGAADWGYRKHLGSHVIKTDFGHTQIVSILRATVYTDEASQPEDILPTPADRDVTYSSQIVNLFLVNIYDVTTGERWEEPLYAHTSEGGMGTSDLEFRKGNFESCLFEDCQSWVAWQGDDPFFFAEVGDTLYFGSRSVPLYAYSPSTFRGNRHQQVATFRDGTHGDGDPHAVGTYGGRPEWMSPYCESALVWRVRPSPGQYPETFNYRTESTLPQPEALIAFDGALVIANERLLYFSNIFAPTVYIDENVVIVPTEKEIVALGRAGQSIYIFTETETWAYSPGTSQLLAVGMAPVRISDTIGCISQNATANYGEALIWVSLDGVHVASGGLDIQTISQPIEPLFTDFITDPCTTFFTATTANTGSTTTEAPQRNSLVKIERGMINATYCTHLRALLITLPNQRAALCYAGDQWSLWSFESNTKEQTGAYGARPTLEKNISAPWLLSIDESLFCVGGIDSEAFADYAQGNTGGGYWFDNVSAASLCVLEYGRGGAIDRSVDDEDYRMVAGKYRIDWSNMGGAPWSTELQNSRIVFDKWIPMEHAYKFWGGTIATPVAAVSGEAAPAAPEVTFLVPIKLVPAVNFFDPLVKGADHGIRRITVRFRFDSVHWQPIFADGSSTEVEMLLPPERMSSRSSWTTRECQDSASAYAPSRDGDCIVLHWDGTAGTWEGTGNHQTVAATSGGMNAPIYRESVLCYIAMKTRSSVTYPRGLSTMGILVDDPADPTKPFASITNNQPVGLSTHAVGYIWQQWARFARHREDIQGPAGAGSSSPLAQPVDWAYMGPDIGLNSDTRVKLRGLAVTLMGRGQGTDTVNSWTQGLFNTMLAADLKTWMAQVVDYIGGVATFRRPVSVKTNLYPTPRTEQTIRDRIPAATPGQRAEFGAGAEYGQPASVQASFESDTYLIGDEQVDTIVTSDSVKGTSASAMIFGFMRNPAERLKIQSVKALLRGVGASRRRKGR